MIRPTLEPYKHKVLQIADTQGKLLAIKYLRHLEYDAGKRFDYSLMELAHFVTNTVNERDADLYRNHKIAVQNFNAVLQSLVKLTKKYERDEKRRDQLSPEIIEARELILKLKAERTAYLIQFEK